MTIAQPARLAPEFRPAADLVPSFSAAGHSTHDDPSACQQAGGATVIKFQAVGRREASKRNGTRRNLSAQVRPFVEASLRRSRFRRLEFTNLFKTFTG